MTKFTLRDKVILQNGLICTVVGIFLNENDDTAYVVRDGQARSFYADEDNIALYVEISKAEGVFA